MYTAKNQLVISLVLPTDRDILDVGCGTGNTAAAIKASGDNPKIVGINNSKKELAVAGNSLDHGIIFDLNSTKPLKLDRHFDFIICSHILEHLVDPKARVTQLATHLKEGGRMILVVPNFAIWKARLRLLSGKFEYESHGLYDRTHLRFYTWNSFPGEVVPEGYEIVSTHASGNFPMPFIRRFLPNALAKSIDGFFLQCCPNMFSSEVGLLIRKSEN